MGAVAYKDSDLFELRFLPSGYLTAQSKEIIQKEMIDANGGKRNRHNTITGSSNYQSDGHAKITSLIGMPHIVMSVITNSSHQKNMVANTVELGRLNTQLDMIIAAGAANVVQQMETIRQMAANIDVAPTAIQPAIDVLKKIENPPLPSQEKKSQAVLDSLDVKPVDSAPQPKQQEADQVLKPIVSEVKNSPSAVALENSDVEVVSSPLNKQETLKSNDAKVSSNQPDVPEIKSNVTPIEVVASKPSSTQVDKVIETARIDTSAQPKQQVEAQVVKPIISEVKNSPSAIAPQNSDVEVVSSPLNKQEALKSNDAKVSSNQPDVPEIKSNVTPIEVAASQSSSTQVDKAIETARIDTSAQLKQQVTASSENLNANVLDTRVSKIDVSVQKSDVTQKFSEPVKPSVATVNKSTVSQPAPQQPSQSNFATALKAAAASPMTPLVQTQSYQTRPTAVVQSQIPQTSTAQMKGVTSPATPYIQPQVTTSVAPIVTNQLHIQPKVQAQSQAEAQPQAAIQMSAPKKQEIRQETPPVVIQVQKPKVETVQTTVIPQSSDTSTVNPKTADKQPPKTEVVKPVIEVKVPTISAKADTSVAITTRNDLQPSIPKQTTPEQKIVTPDVEKIKFVEPQKTAPEVKIQQPLEFRKIEEQGFKPQKLVDNQPVFKSHEPVSGGQEFKKSDPIIIKPAEVKPIEPVREPRLELKDFMPKGSACGGCKGERGCCLAFDKATESKTTAVTQSLVAENKGISAKALKL